MKRRLQFKSQLKQLEWLALALLAVCVVPVLIVLLFPERCAMLIAPRVAPGINCSVDRITWRKWGAEIDGLHIAAPSFTAVIAHASAWRQQGQWRLFLANGTVSLARAASPTAAKSSQSNGWTTLPRIATRFPLAFNLAGLFVCAPVGTGGSQLGALVGAHGVLDCRQPTQFWCMVTVVQSGSPSITVQARLWQSGEAAGADLPACALDPGALTQLLMPGLPVTAKGSVLHASVSGVAGESWGTAVLTKVSCELESAARTMTVATPKLSVKNPRMTASLRLKRNLTLPYVPMDPIGYLMARFDAAITGRADEIKMGSLRLSNIVFAAEVVSNRLDLRDARLTMFGGVVAGSGSFERRKVKEKEAYRFLYDASVTLTNVDAGMFCHTFNMDTNRAEGAFNGAMSASGFGRRVISLSGSLESSGGTLFLPESGKYVAAMNAGMQKQLADIKTRQLQQYEFRKSIVSFHYAPQDTTTVVRLEFNGKLDTCTFPIVYDGSWIDAIQFLMTLK